MRGQRVRSAVAPALAPAVARTLALGCRQAARNHASFSRCRARRGPVNGSRAKGERPHPSGGCRAQAAPSASAPWGRSPFARRPSVLAPSDRDSHLVTASSAVIDRSSTEALIRETSKSMTMIRARPNQIRIVRPICRFHEPSHNALVRTARFIGDTHRPRLESSSGDRRRAGRAFAPAGRFWPCARRRPGCSRRSHPAGAGLRP
jgi:hypothetical protein